MKASLLKYILIIGIISLCKTPVSAQSERLSKLQVGKRIHDGIDDNYHPDSVALSKLCRHACIFIKFKVNLKGKISEVSFSKDQDSVIFIKNALTKAVYSLQKDLKLMEALKRSGRTIIQPFIYTYEAGCHFPKGSGFDANLSMTENERNQWALKDLRIRNTMDHFWETLSNMMNFGNGSTHVFNNDNLNVIDNCLLIAPIEVSNIVME